MYKIKKIMAVALIAVHCISMSIPAYAATNVVTVTEGKKITPRKITPRIYESGSFYGDDQTRFHKEFFIDEGDSEASIDIQLDDTAQQYKIEVRVNLKYVLKKTVTGDWSGTISNIDYTDKCELRILPLGDGTEYSYTISSY